MRRFHQARTRILFKVLFCIVKRGLSRFLLRVLLLRFAIRSRNQSAGRVKRVNGNQVIMIMPVPILPNPIFQFVIVCNMTLDSKVLAGVLLRRVNPFAGLSPDKL